MHRSCLYFIQLVVWREVVISVIYEAFGLVGTAIDINDMRVAVTKGVRTGDWNDAFRTAERLATSGLASAAVAFAALTATLMGIVGYALIMAFTSALIDDALMDRINKFVMSL
ncbi:colicin-like pore-forming protein [Enterobacillus tribolii]|uniref:Colicin pore forming domain-containing protein n=1 Tax=Enterobacillus tribolii TaxID=1487935 RepID=A0A370R0V1_9GAMM|nr:colicin-like pore-forming protein [Enterobacillus tribolii]MBW7982894.1 hypothetical protein [Enterobacillus tribolii]RDK95545.1 colicin pore forming domain-containing protein [Enterobacillus tribolii]